MTTKKTKLILVSTLLLSQLAAVLPAAAESAGANPSTTLEAPAAVNSVSRDLTLTMNSDTMEQNGVIYKSLQPMTVIKGVSYISVRSLAERLGYQLTFDNKTKETIIIYGDNELRFKANNSTYRVNGVAQPMRGPSIVTKNIFMVPLTNITKALNIPYSVSGKKVILKLETKPQASFSIQPDVIYAGETFVNYTTQSSSPMGLPIMEERWEGKEDVFANPGIYPVTYSVMDSTGQWSDPFILQVKVVKPNTPPVAEFITDKNEYRMGEFIQITDKSTDDEGIVSTDWNNKEMAFFEPGEVTISLTVYDRHGASSYTEQRIRITDQTLYSEDEFYLRYTPVGSNLTIDGSSIISMEQIPFNYTTEPYTLYRSTGPESVYQEGILYQDTIMGPTRFLLHHKNKMPQAVKLYVVAKNNNAQPATLYVEGFGVAGSTPFPEIAGKLSLARLLESTETGSKQETITLAPGESRVIFTDLSKINIPSEEIVTMLAELTSDSPVQYTTMLIKSGREPLAALPTLSILDSFASILRGSFPDANRVLEHHEVVGNTKSRLYLTDNVVDRFQTGIDGTSGLIATNSGNYGVMYKLVLYRVAANTLVSFNPRGGAYSGSAMVNGNIISFAHTGKINVSDQSSVLYRTRNFEETVEIWISPSAGSNMPFTLLFTPMPPVKE